jgi:hypothetical protein
MLIRTALMRSRLQRPIRVGYAVTRPMQVSVLEVPYGIEFTPVNTDPVVEGESKDFTAVLTSPPTQASYDSIYSN